MFKELTTAHCLYDLSQESLDIFLDLASTHTFEEDISVPLSLNAVDNCAVVLQIWCMLNEDELKFTFNTDKIMAYGCNYYCLNLLKNDKDIKRFLSGRKSTQNLKYVLAYHLAYATSCWIYELMLENDNGTSLIEINMNSNYFLYAEEQNLTNNPEHCFYLTQRYITQLLATDFQNSNRYKRYIETALQKTKNLLNR